MDYPDTQGRPHTSIRGGINGCNKIPPVGYIVFLFKKSPGITSD